MTDAVDHPAHYGGEEDPYEVIKVAEAWGFDKNAYLFNILKYIRREKGHTLEDLKKARFYLNRLITRLEGEIPAGTITGDNLSSSSIVGYSACLSVHTGSTNDPFECYAVHAHTDWTIETLASIVATGAGKGSGTYGLSLSPDSALMYSDETVSWLLRTFPPDGHEYYLRKA